MKNGTDDVDYRIQSLFPTNGPGSGTVDMPLDQFVTTLKVQYDVGFLFLFHRFLIYHCSYFRSDADLGLGLNLSDGVACSHTLSKHGLHGVKHARTTLQEHATLSRN